MSEEQTRFELNRWIESYERRAQHPRSTPAEQAVCLQKLRELRAELATLSPQTAPKPPAVQPVKPAVQPVKPAKRPSPAPAPAPAPAPPFNFWEFFSGKWAKGPLNLKLNKGGLTVGLGGPVEVKLKRPRSKR